MLIQCQRSHWQRGHVMTLLLTTQGWCQRSRLPRGHGGQWLWWKSSYLKINWHVSIVDETVCKPVFACSYGAWAVWGLYVESFKQKNNGRKSCDTVPLKGMCHDIFDLFICHASNPSGPRIERFNIFSNSVSISQRYYLYKWIEIPQWHRGFRLRGGEWLRVVWLSGVFLSAELRRKHTVYCITINLAYWKGTARWAHPPGVNISAKLKTNSKAFKPFNQ